MPRASKPKTLSIRDVAELAGVSLGSASRVINKVANVSEATREKVERAIAQLGYRPNHAAQSLRLRSSRTVGCLLTDVANPLYAKLYRGLEERLRPHGYMMLLANSLNQAEREIEILSTFVSRGMDGLLIAPGNERDREVLAAVRSLPVPTVILDRDMDSPTDSVLFEHVPGVKNLVQYLAGLGHKRIAMVLSQSPNRPIRRRTEGYRMGHKLAKLEVNEEFIVHLPSATSSAFEAVSTLLRRTDRPTALLVMGTTILNDTLNAIGAQRLRIPDDVSVVSFGDPDFAAGHAPAISSLRIDLEKAADEATALLLARMRGDDGPPKSVTLVSDFIPRGSCGPAPKKT
ncbi:MAG: LacI family DNA-binding transcriptional regulator [Rhizobacter sp.]|nr:LacI family DNA-binding transcriptional regulator [Rhizobacter sp.]